MKLHECRGNPEERLQGVVLWTLDRHGLRSCHAFSVKPGPGAWIDAWLFGATFHSTPLVWPVLADNFPQRNNDNR